MLEEIGQRFTDVSGAKVVGTYGASGLLRERIAKGGSTELFASANT